VRVNRSIRYATELLVEIAQSARDDPISISTVAENRSLPEGFLKQLAVGLSHAGLLSAHPGCRGGYVLGRPAESITLKDIVEALDGPIQEAVDCSGSKPSQTLWTKLGGEWAAVLDRHSVKELVKQLPRPEA
jgi:Rrf2 family protein